MTLAEPTPNLASVIVPPAGVNRLFVAGTHAGYRQHAATFGPLPLARIGTPFITTLEASGLTGRGGAGFPAWRKLAATEAARAASPWRGSAVVIANGAEGEPRSLKDETLLQNAPHLVIDGLLVMAAVVSASKVYLYTTAGSLPFVRAALDERADARHILLREAPETFISGEASAVANAIENGVALPTDRIVRLSESGVKKRPTLVQNVETLAHVALIARFGARWFGGVGSDRDPGTRLVTVSGDVQNEQVLEVAGDTSVREILAACGTVPADVSAVLVSGYHGAWVPAEQLDLRLSDAGLSGLGAQPGAGILFVLGSKRCGIVATAEIVEYLASQSAGQCGPCMFGLPAIADLFVQVARGRASRRAVTELQRLTKSVVGRGSCHHPDGTSRLVLSALSVFSADLQRHQSGQCIAGRTTNRAS
ncbi:hypothetical protein B7R21_08960 [Subtercola boreus]|uniref:NADH-ubiquinone oxidoreductase 51kDa subunit iron-sulphur binding domain-containing protein n=1 Tax=Subtercola boreus TaxID=120213 RepID=A0A3E0VVV2_9MICO|nr:NADH-ubiquinone oxidoreductase-F iron-sulfur binding region domain-containing protein [Subtercola boreus]RFA12967.1 hypothetical protein B7R21_08960 [Subtercola boreus]